MKEKALLGILLVDFIFSGAGSSLSLKAMSMYDVAPAPGETPIPFNHPYMQTLCMFIGEAFCLVIYFIYRGVERRKARRSNYEELRVTRADAEIEAYLNSEVPATALPGRAYAAIDRRDFRLPDIFKFAVPTICDLVASTLFNISLYYCDVSVYQMLRNLSMLFVAVLSACIWRDFRRKFDLAQYIGLTLLMVGACIVAYAAIAFSEQAKARNYALGIALTIAGTFVFAFFYISEEIFLRKINVVPMLGVGIEGSWGIVFNALLLPLYNMVICPWNDNGSVFEDSAAWMYQVFVACRLYIVFHMAYIIFTLLYNQSGMELTARASASFRTTFDSCRTIVAFVLSLCFGWEVWHTGSSLLRIFGFVLITIGVLLYNDIIIVLPYFRRENAVRNKGKWVQDLRERRRAGDAVYPLEQAGNADITAAVGQSADGLKE